MASPHGITMIDPRRERAYLVYRDQERRSLRKTAEAMGIPEGTVMAWSREDGWQQRLRDDDDRAITAMRRDAELALIGKHDQLIEEMWHTALHATDERVRADMQKYLAGVLGYSPQVAAARVGKGQEHQLGANAELLRHPGTEGKTLEEMRAIAARPINRVEP